MKRVISGVILLMMVLQVSIAQTQKPADDGVLKILAIGNSFSEDALESYLYELATAANKKISIGNLYIGGAPLSLHVENAHQDKKSYQYRKIDLDGKKTNTKNISIAEAIADENWDYISLQQASSLSGLLPVIMKDLPALIAYVQGQALPTTNLVYHQTWAYQQDSPHKGFVTYNKSQQTMYEEIMKATKKIGEDSAFVFVTPSGTAIQNARSSSLGDTFTRDGYHLELGYGRFTAACTWYEMLFGLDVRKNSYKPQQISDKEAKIAKSAAHKAVRKPYKISKIKI